MLRKTLIAVAALATLSTGVAGVAEARTYSNGFKMNGFNLNAFSRNGLMKNGISVNGAEAMQDALPAAHAITLPNGVSFQAQ